jgi:SNF2 family DNA or RNA helicase
MGEKTIVFSQFTTMLDLIELFLKDAGITFVRCELSTRISSKHIADNLPLLIKMTGACLRKSGRSVWTR